ncbi:MAG: DUF3500 domain-containing protein [Chloroflexi bacterium]|nr:MAG: DUF3500 domain-containing protein [Chloroflexota bacterium]
MAAGGAAMVAAAAELLDGLDVAAREGALLAFDDPRRLRWSYLPGERVGLPMRAMDGDQRLLAHRLLRTALSLPALAQAVTVGAWETVLEAVERRDDGRRDPGRYHVTIFDPPSATGRWGWRFEGHHLSVSVTLQGGVVVAATPLFLGANPARVSFEGGGTLRPLAVEEDLARELHAALDGERRARAVVAAEAPADILSRMSVRAGDLPSDGVAASDLDPAERSLLRRLVRLYTGRLAPEVAPLFAGVEDDPALRFAWAGGAEPGAPHYYRLLGERLLVEYDCRQDGANHVHTVVRDPRGDLDVDPLRAHVAAAHGGDA